jgi:predicted signal transduction protein with EAL and GGDEF domain
MNELTDHLLRLAAGVACTWPDDVTLSFNISPSQLKDHTLGERILSILAESGLSPRRLEIELTESALVGDMEGAQEILGMLRDAGVRIALDDFGTGYSSLYHLRNFKVDKIKIDRSFVDNMERDADANALVRALLGLGHGLGVKRRDLGTPPESIKSDTCRADRRRNPAPINTGSRCCPLSTP